MEYKFGVKDRLMLLGILPPEGNLATIRIVRELREALSFGEAEHGDLQIVQQGEQIAWSAEQEAISGPKAVDIGGKGQEIIREALEKLDKDEKLTDDLLDL